MRIFLEVLYVCWSNSHSMLLAVIKSYRQHVSIHQNTFIYILEMNKTFLKKAGLTALKKFTNN